MKIESFQNAIKYRKNFQNIQEMSPHFFIWRMSTKVEQKIQTLLGSRNYTLTKEWELLNQNLGKVIRPNKLY